MMTFKISLASSVESGIWLSFSHKVGPIGNRHIKDHILCNFHATHPYLIHVANFVNVVIDDRSSYNYD